jgi:hypothetical protein
MNPTMSRLLKSISNLLIKFIKMVNSESMLTRNETTLLVENRRNNKIVIGAPHHAPGGIVTLPCEEHRDSDENTGIIARRVAEKLNVCSIIACNYQVDANKSLGTDYSIQIIKWEPKYLIEIHGHGGKSTNPKNCIEISAGSIGKNGLSIKFACNLKKKFEANPNFESIPVKGDFNEIHFKAENTATITSGNWEALHIELPPNLRKNGNDLPSNINEFIDILSETISEICV